MSLSRLENQIKRLDNLPRHLHLRKRPILLTDSKGRYLGDCSVRGIDHSIIWWDKSGATTSERLQFVKDNLELAIERYGPIVLYVWTGTCDLTVKEGHFIQLKSRDNTAVNELIATYKEIYSYVSKFSHVKLVFLELPHYSIYNWNFTYHHITPGIFKYDDFKLSGQIDQVNTFIRETNLMLRGHSPKFSVDLENCCADRTSYSYGNRYSYKFNSYYIDGIHPCPTLARLWLIRICRCIISDCS